MDDDAVPLVVDGPRIGLGEKRLFGIVADGYRRVDRAVSPRFAPSHRAEDTTIRDAATMCPRHELFAGRLDQHMHATSVSGGHPRFKGKRRGDWGSIAAPLNSMPDCGRLSVTATGRYENLVITAIALNRWRGRSTSTAMRI